MSNRVNLVISDVVPRSREASRGVPGSVVDMPALVLTLAGHDGGTRGPRVGCGADGTDRTRGTVPGTVAAATSDVTGVQDVTGAEGVPGGMPMALVADGLVRRAAATRAAADDPPVLAGTSGSRVTVTIGPAGTVAHAVMILTSRVAMTAASQVPASTPVVTLAATTVAVLSAVAMDAGRTTAARSRGTSVVDTEGRPKRAVIDARGGPTNSRIPVAPAVGTRRSRATNVRDVSLSLPCPRRSPVTNWTRTCASSCAP